jgi:hypothetical protein
MPTESFIEFIDGVKHYFTSVNCWQRNASLNSLESWGTILLACIDDNKGNNKIIELRTFFQRESQNS